MRADSARGRFVEHRIVTGPSLLARAAILCLAAALAVAALAAEPVPGGTLIVGGGADPRHLNPAVQSGGNTGVPGAQLFAGLIRIDDGFEPRPYVAEPPASTTAAPSPRKTSPSRSASSGSTTRSASPCSTRSRASTPRTRSPPSFG